MVNEEEEEFPPDILCYETTESYIFEENMVDEEHWIHWESQED